MYSLFQNGKPKKKSKKSEAEDGAVKGVFIEMSQHVTLTFSLKYLVNFSKSAALAPQVRLMLKSDVPLLVRSVILLDSMNTRELIHAFLVILGRVPLRARSRPILPCSQDWR